MRSVLLASFGVVALLTQQAGAEVIIDNFNDPFGTTVSAVGNPVTVTTAASGSTPDILGGYRDQTFSFNPAGSQGQATIQYNGQRESTSYATTGTSADVTITYDGLGVPGSGLGGANLSGDTGFILAADWNPNASGAGTPLVLGVTVNGVLRTVAIPDMATVTPYFIPFAYWGISVDFSSVNTIALSFRLNDTDNAQFGDFRTGLPGDLEFAPLVPEPTSIALACMGLVGFGGYARRKMKASA